MILVLIGKYGYSVMTCLNTEKCGTKSATEKRYHYMKTIITHSPEETEKAGAALAERLRGTKFFVAMFGDLGAGKTVFVRGFAGVLSSGSRVKSPTYTIVNEYRKGNIPLFHFDFYRVENTEELDGFGFEEYTAGGGCIAEWSENLGDRLPTDAVKVRIEKTGENERKITIEGLSDW